MNCAALLLIASALLTAASCELIGGSDADTPRPLGNGRIVFGESIEGVTLGDDFATVTLKLGEPDNVAIGDFPGRVFIYWYPLPEAEGFRDSLAVTIIHPNSVGWEEGVEAVRVSGPYSGSTRGGVGIGTSRERAVRLLGTPDTSRSDVKADEIVDTYYFDAMAFSVAYARNRIQTIRMRRYDPALKPGPARGGPLPRSSGPSRH